MITTVAFTKALLVKVLACVSVVLFWLLVFAPSTQAAIISDGVWTQSDDPGTTTITFEMPADMPAGDYVRLTFPDEAVIDSTGTHVTMTGQSPAIRLNLRVRNSIDIETTSLVPAGTVVTIVMDDALISYDRTQYFQQTVAINHNDDQDVGINSGAANINNNSTSVLAAVPPHFIMNGWFYNEETGEVITGGSITVSGPGQTHLSHDGSTGFYQWNAAGIDGIYTISVSTPPGYEASTSCNVQPGSLAAPDATLTLGNDQDSSSGLLTSASCTDFYYTVDIDFTDPGVLLNNIPLKAGLSKTGQAARASLVVGGGIIVLAAGSYVLNLGQRKHVRMENKTSTKEKK